MIAATRIVQRWFSECAAAWDRFWFTPARPHTLAAIRILAGAMLLYTHLVWAMDLQAFLGRDAWLTSELSAQFTGSRYAWSHLWLIDSTPALWISHIAALIVFSLLTAGLWTRPVSILAWLLTVSYCHRLQGALFGLDQVNAMLAMYLMVGRSGDAYSIDRWRMRGRAGGAPPETATSTNVAIRLIQLHMCIIYLFGGIGKMRGEMWWDGSAFWYSIANLEYQSLDVTWLVAYPLLIAALTHVTVFWETFYCFLIWPRLTRPLMLAIACCVHGGIALCLGMITFGTAMLIGNLAFVPPGAIESVVDRCCRRHSRSPADASRRTK